MASNMKNPIMKEVPIASASIRRAKPSRKLAFRGLTYCQCAVLRDPKSDFRFLAYPWAKPTHNCAQPNGRPRASSRPRRGIRSGSRPSGCGSMRETSCQGTSSSQWTARASWSNWSWNIKPKLPFTTCTLMVYIPTTSQPVTTRFWYTTVVIPLSIAIDCPMEPSRNSARRVKLMHLAKDRRSGRWMNCIHQLAARAGGWKHGTRKGISGKSAMTLGLCMCMIPSMRWEGPLVNGQVGGNLGSGGDG